MGILEIEVLVCVCVRVCLCVLCVLGKLSGEMDPLFVFAQDRRVLLAILTESMFS